VILIFLNRQIAKPTKAAKRAIAFKIQFKNQTVFKIKISIMYVVAIY
jgi:hypothetical protein